eukprot:3513364-Pyramimonas_sp.AAC.1
MSTRPPLRVQVKDDDEELDGTTDPYSSRPQAHGGLGACAYLGLLGKLTGGTLPDATSVPTKVHMASQLDGLPAQS